MSHGQERNQPQQPASSSGKSGKLLQNTSLCKHYQRGHCRLGSECAYAHEMGELKPKPNFAKTRLCPRFKAGSCTVENCTFAHGANERVRKKWDTDKLRRLNSLVPSNSGSPPNNLGNHNAGSSRAKASTHRSNERCQLLPPHPDQYALFSADSAAEDTGFVKSVLAKWQKSTAADFAADGVQPARPVGLQASASTYAASPQIGALAFPQQFLQVNQQAQAEEAQRRCGNLPVGLRPADVSQGQNFQINPNDQFKRQISPNDDQFIRQISPNDQYIRPEQGIMFISQSSQAQDEYQQEYLQEVSERGVQRWRFLSRRLLAENMSSKENLHHWLRSWEHKEHLSAAAHKKIADLFLRDPAWASKFPCLWLRCAGPAAAKLAWADESDTSTSQGGSSDVVHSGGSISL